jgi:glyoxylase-like metal-dependent hydrolase (beta-lactamase superfamily II)
VRRLPPAIVAAPLVVLSGLVLGACRAPAPTPAPAPAAAARRWCDELPRPANQALEHLGRRADWFEVYRAADGVFAIVEPYQFQEAISYLIVGAREALLFDSGLGMVPIAPVVKELTSLPVTVLNSHTHFDHVGGNAEFDRVLAMDTAYTRANTQGFPHEALLGEIAPEAFCRPLPAGSDSGAYRSRPWTPTAFIKDGHRIDLGGRTLEVLQSPGHTPDAVALYDAGSGLLFTGDTFYEGTIWLFVPETSLSAYATSVDRLAALVPRLKKVLPAHNGASARPEWLTELRDAVAVVRARPASGKVTGEGQVTFTFAHFSILTSQKALTGWSGPAERGGSGLSGQSLVPPAPASPPS